MRLTFLDETIDFMERHGVIPEYVDWVGNLTHHMTWEEFAKQANFVYNGDSRNPVIDLDLVIMGKAVGINNIWWMKRIVADLDEYWEFHKAPRKGAIDEPFQVKVRYIHPHGLNKDE